MASWGADGGEIVVSAADLEIRSVLLAGKTYDRADLPGSVWSGGPGYPAVPVLGTLLGVPYGVEISVEVAEADYEEIAGVELMPVPELRFIGRGIFQLAREQYEADPWTYGQDRFFPAEQGVVTRTGILRDQRVAALSLRPVQYNPVRKILRIARELRVRVRLVGRGGGRPLVAPPAKGREGVLEPFYRRALLNSEGARGWRGRSIGTSPFLRKLQPGWYDPTATYTKLRIREDGVYRMDGDWFADAGIALEPGDLEQMKLYLNGQEVPIDVRDGGDGDLDPGDAVYFYGEYRRAVDRDFENDLGRESTYWLTVTRGAGRRFRATPAAPESGFPASVRFTATVHAEVDSMFEPLGLAADADRDHWFWGRTASPSPRSDEYPVTVPVVLPGLDRNGGGTASVRVGMHGLAAVKDLDPDHSTEVLLGSGTVVAQDRWDGAAAFEASGTVPVSDLEDTTWVTLRTPGLPTFPEEYVDNALLNWVEVSYSRRYEAEEGSLLFELEAESAGLSLSVGGLRAPWVRVYEVDEGTVLEGVQVGQEGTEYRADFEVQAGGGRFVAVDSGAVRQPEAGERDAASDLLGERDGAEYVIVTHPLLREAAEQLADHRREGGMSALVVDVTDIYDEFSFGNLDPRAIQAFTSHAFENWAQRPVYLLLFGRASFDYRDLYGVAPFGRRNLVPALPFQEAFRRGLAFTDHLYGTVAGDDLFQDVFVGRFNVNSRREADAVVRKVTGYDGVPSARWRDRVLYMASSDVFFTAPSDSLAANYTESVGLETYRLYSPDPPVPEPNENTREMIQQINEGRLVVNFIGHGGAALMAYFFRGSFQEGDYSYMTQVVNGERLPLVVAMACFNGIYADPNVVSLAEEMTRKADGGAIAYMSASSLAGVFTNTFMNKAMFRHIFRGGVRQFGPSLALGKTDMLAAFPKATLEPVLGMNLMGDPGQALAVPEGPDYVLPDGGLALAGRGELAVGDSVLVRIRVENWGVVSETGPGVILVDRNLDGSTADTLFAGVLSPFGHADSAVVLWRPSRPAGLHRLEASIDPEDRIDELDEGNNYRELEFEVFGALTALPTMPLQSQVVAAAGLVLVVHPVGGASGDVLGEFEVSRDPIFGEPSTLRSGWVLGEDGVVTWQPPDLGSGAQYWRARLSDGRDTGPWTDVRMFEPVSTAPEREVIWRQNGDHAFRMGTVTDAALFEDGSVGRMETPPPVRFDQDTRETSFAAEGLDGAAVVCTDGTYLYVKRFYTDPPIYPGTDVFERIGTGFGGTVPGQNYGKLAEEAIPGISATYHGDGFIYADEGKANEIVRISPSTGRVERVPVPDGLLEVSTGIVIQGVSLITSDGRYVYNAAWGVKGVKRAGWTVRVFDPSDGWRKVREFQVAPTSTGFAYLYTDGFLVDGRYLYLIEYGTGLRHRVRVADAQDGRFVAEFESDQAETDVLGGQYDWINNRVWLGQLEGPMVYRYRGVALPGIGILTSGPIGPAGTWGSLRVDVLPGKTPGGRMEIDVLGEGPSGLFTPLPEWTGLAPDAGIDLSRIDAGTTRRIKLEGRFLGEGLTPTPRLTEWEVRFQPVSNVVISGLRTEPKVVEETQPVTVTVDVVNQGPLSLTLGTVVAFYSGPPESGLLVGRAAVPENTPPGRKTPVSVVWHTAGFGGEHTLSARLEDFTGSPSFYVRQVMSEETVEVTPSGDREAPEVVITALDAAGEVRPEDFLPSEPRLRVAFLDSSGIDAESVRILVTGTLGEISADLSSPRVSEEAEDRTSLVFVYTPTLEDDRYVMDVSGTDRLGNGPARKTLAFRVSSELRIESLLNVPNPVSDGTDFTYILSRRATVAVRVYTVSGRLVRVLDGLSGRPGFNQVYWDGRDGEGNLLANGVYLYTATADDGLDRVRAKERLIVYR